MYIYENITDNLITDMFEMIGSIKYKTQERISRNLVFKKKINFKDLFLQRVIVVVSDLIF